jgi:ubiquitin carboxyl-terminal hydrolase 16/45
VDTSPPASGNTASPPSDHTSKHSRFSKYNKFNSKNSKSSKKGAATLGPDDFKKETTNNNDDEPVIDTKDKRMSKHQEKKLRKLSKKSKKKGKPNNDENEEEKGETNNKHAEEEPSAETKDQTDLNEANPNEMPKSESIGAKMENLDLSDKPPGESIEKIKLENEEKVFRESDNEVDSDEETGVSERKSENKFKHEAQKSVREPAQETFAPGSLQSYLARFTSRELLNDKINCENCTRKLNAGSSTSSMSKFSLSRIMMHLNSSNARKAYTHATKQYLICDLPAILTIHLKRFQQHGMRLEKSNKFVDFPLTLDMSPYTSRMCINRSENDESVVYELYGLVEHSGKLNSGHYTACVRAMPQATNQNEDNQSALDSMGRFLSQQRLCHLNKMFNVWSNMQQHGDGEQHLHSNKNKTIELNNSEASNDKWFYVSDSSVSEISVTKVLKSQAYILFYQRIQ